MSIPAITLEATVKPDGTLELAQPVALPPGRVQVTIVPLPDPSQEEQEEEITVGSPEWKKLTERRAALIDKMYGPGQELTEEERAEFERLQRRSRKAIDKAFPRPRLEPGELAAVKQALGIEEDVGGQ